MEWIKVQKSGIDQYNFVVFIVMSIVIAAFLVIVSMHLYNSSGAAQLDLSRPGYVDVRAKAVTNNGYKDYPSIGTIDLKTINDFQDLFLKQSSKITSANVFSGDPLSPEALGIGAVF